MGKLKFISLEILYAFYFIIYLQQKFHKFQKVLMTSQLCKLMHDELRCKLLQ